MPKPVPTCGNEILLSENEKDGKQYECSMDIVDFFRLIRSVMKSLFIKMTQGCYRCVYKAMLF